MESSYTIPESLVKKANNTDEIDYLNERWQQYNTNSRTKNDAEAVIRAKCLRDLGAWRKEQEKKKTEPVKINSSSNIKTLSDMKPTPLENPWANQKPAPTLADMGFQLRVATSEEMRFLGQASSPFERNVSRDMNGAPEPSREGMYDSCYTMGISSNFLKALVGGDRTITGHGSWPWDCDDLFRCVVFIQRHTKGNVGAREELTNALAQLPNISPYWKALFTRWTWLTNEVLYSNRLSIETISNMLSLVMGYTTGDFGFLKNRTMTGELQEAIRVATAEVNGAWGNYDWTNDNFRLRLVAYSERNEETGRLELHVVDGENPNSEGVQFARRFIDIINGTDN